jgi:imidazolonepropionase-like amidohydrolase
VSDQEVDEEFIRLAKSKGTIYTPTLTVSSGYTLAYRAAAGIAAFPIEDPNGCVDTKTKERLKKASQFEDHPRFSKSFKERLQSFDPKTDRLSDTDLKNLQKVYEAGIPIAVGTDAGNPGTLHGVSIYNELEAMQQAGIPAEDLIVMATQNGAKAMEREQDFGTLESGKLANLIVLEEDPSEDIANIRSIEQVMLNGKIKKVDEITGD